MPQLWNCRHQLSAWQLLSKLLDEVPRKDSPVNGMSATMSIGISGPMGGW